MALQKDFDPGWGNQVSAYHKIMDFKGDGSIRITVASYVSKASSDVGQPAFAKRDYGFAYDKAGANLHIQGYTHLKENEADFQDAVDIL